MEASSHEGATWHTQVPTRILDHASPSHRRHRLANTVPHITRSRQLAGEPESHAEATRRRRWLLAIFGRMMARFYERHERRLSAGRHTCTICQRRIVAWAWQSLLPPSAEEVVHEACMSRSIWEMVLYYEYLVRSGYSTADPGI